MIFAFSVRPFEHGDMDDSKWIYVSVGFSLIVFIVYAMVSLVQYLIHRKILRWHISLEVGVYVFFFLIYAILTYFYYRSPMVEGFYGFTEFLEKIIFNIFLIMTPILFVARRFVLQFLPPPDTEILIRGENKLDILRLQQSDLICISNAQNYVEIYYLHDGELKTKLIRSSLKKMQSDIDFLMQVHRSHLINPTHFKSWKDAKTVSLTHLDLPVSKNYKEQLLSL